MKMTIRWFGVDDSVSLKYIKQIPGITGVVSAIYDVAVGEAWSKEKILYLKSIIEKEGLEWEVVESVPVHEDIKLKRGNYQRYIENYKTTLRNLSECGIKCVCYNFMPIFDWTRSSVSSNLEDGSHALVYYKDEVETLDPKKMSLPGWDVSYTPKEVEELIEAYTQIGDDGLWSNYEYFIKEIIPVASEVDIYMGVHPDDPPWSIFGIPRIIKNENDIDKLLSFMPNKHHGLTLCSGSLGCSNQNDIPSLIRKYGKDNRIHFAHVRNVKILADGSFEESAHFSQCGSLDMRKIMSAYREIGFKGYIRPDHGRMIFGETGKPGYGLYDRAIGASYLLGMWEMLEEN